jgi:hypothetical protein
VFAGLSNFVQVANMYVVHDNEQQPWTTPFYLTAYYVDVEPVVSPPWLMGDLPDHFDGWAGFM